MIKYLFFRFLGHACAIVPVICETICVLPYNEAGTFLDKIKITASAAVIISIVVFCLLKNVLKEK